MARLRILAVLTALGACGGTGIPAPEIPPIDDESMVSGEGLREVAEGAALPEAGGPLVRMGRVRIGRGKSLSLPGSACLEAVIFVEEGNLRTPADEDLPGGTLYRTQRITDLVATEAAVAIVALNRPPGAAAADGVAAPSAAAPSAAAPSAAEDPGPGRCSRNVMGDVVVDLGSVETLAQPGGKFNVQIVIDADGGATFGAFNILEAEGDVDVPLHTHDASAEVLFIDQGDGIMILGEERFAIAPGRVLYVPAGVEHGYEHGSTALRAYQVYDAPGPEQRFRPTELENDR